MSINKRLEIFDELNLHDQDLTSFEIDFVVKKIIFKVNVYSELSLAYEPVKLTFLDFKNFKIDNLSFSEDLEIYTFNVLENDACLKLNLVLLTGMGLPSVNIEFDFQKYSIG